MTGVCVPFSMHVTRILSDGGGPYTAVCTCAWRSDPLPTRAEAVRAAELHRLNMKVQEENP